MSKGITQDLLEDYISSHYEELEEYEINSARNVYSKKTNFYGNEQKINTILIKKRI